MQVKDLKFEELEITAEQSDQELCLRWRGSIHSQDPGDTLEPYVDLVLDLAERDHLKIICDFARLEYMNSASIPPLIHLLRSSAERRIHTSFLYDAARKVQTASFRALDVIARKSEFTSVKGI